MYFVDPQIRYEVFEGEQCRDELELSVSVCRLNGLNPFNCH